MTDIVYQKIRASLEEVLERMKTDPALLDQLIEAARHHAITPEEKRAQRRSWVIGEMGIEHPEMTREDIERLVDEVMD